MWFFPVTKCLWGILLCCVAPMPNSSPCNFFSLPLSILFIVFKSALALKFVMCGKCQGNFFCHLCKNEFDQLVWQLKDPHLSPLFLSSIQYTNRVYLHGMFYCSLLINNLLQERHGFIMGLWCAVDGWEKKTHTSESKLSPETWLAFLLKISCRSVYWSTTTWHFIISERAQH